MATTKKTGAERDKERRTGVALIIAPYILLAIVLIVAMNVRSDDVHDAKVLACEASLENKELMAYVVANSQGDPSQMTTEGLPPELVELIEASQQNQARFIRLVEERLIKPIEICEEVGIESRMTLPEPVSEATTTTEG